MMKRSSTLSWLGMGSIIATMTIAAVVGWAARPLTYREAVSMVLDQLHIAHTEVAVRAICQPDPACIVTTNTQTFIVSVMNDDQERDGRVACYDGGGDCYLYLRDLGVERVPLRDVLGVRLLPRWLGQRAEDLTAWMYRWHRAIN
jgi:hypothetical protein